MIALLGAVLFALLVIGLFNGGEANGNEVVPEVSPADTPRAGLLALLLVEAGLGAYVPAPSPTPAPTTSPAPTPEPTPTLAPAYVPPVYVAPAGGLLCYRPDLVSCATESAIAWSESTHGTNLYNPAPVWIAGVLHNAVGWFGMLYPLHAHHGLVPGGGLASDTAAFYSLITEQGLGPWY